MEVCPVEATVRRADGVVTIYYGKCIGCGMCIAACPYDARFFNPIRHTADKCTFCTHRIDAGLLPACVTSCIGRALTFGDLNDRESEVSRLIVDNATTVLKPALRTNPKVYYIAADKDIMGRIKISEKYPEAIEEYHKTVPSKLSDYWKK